MRRQQFVVAKAMSKAELRAELEGALAAYRGPILRCKPGRPWNEGEAEKRANKAEAKRAKESAGSGRALGGVVEGVEERGRGGDPGRNRIEAVRGAFGERGRPGKWKTNGWPSNAICEGRRGEDGVGAPCRPTPARVAQARIGSPPRPHWGGGPCFAGCAGSQGAPRDIHSAAEAASSSTGTGSIMSSA